MLFHNFGHSYHLSLNLLQLYYIFVEEERPEIHTPFKMQVHHRTAYLHNDFPCIVSVLLSL